MNGPERLLEVAQRLDELSEDLPELQDLSEQLGRIADSWPAPQPQRSGDIPEWLAQIQQIMEQRAAEVLYERYGARDPSSGYVTVNLPNPHYYDAALRQFDAKNPFIAINSI